MFNRDNLPAGADAHIRYQSDSSFGAVLMTQRPITLTAYNDERLFLDWLEKNKPTLLEQYGQQLRKYGMWIVGLLLLFTFYTIWVATNR